MKMQKLVEASPALRKLAGKELPLKVAYELSRMIKKMDEHLSFHDEKWQGMLEEHCTEKEGRWYPKSDADGAELNRKRRELLELEADTGEIRPVVIPAGVNVDISAADLLLLEDFVEIHFEEEK